MNTPTPWKFDSYGHICTAMDDDGIARFDSAVRVHGVMLNSSDTAKANTALIVRAVNSHDALVAALETFERICTRRWRSLPADTPEKQAIDAARAALALAKEPT